MNIRGKKLLAILTPIITVFLLYITATPYLAPSIALPFINSIVDADNDGLFNEQEIQIGTNPLNPDTDGDDLSDGIELSELQTNPLNPDTDGDDLRDGLEVSEWQTDPLNPDTDGDNLKDGTEVNGWQILVDGWVQYNVTSNPLSSDTDTDNLIDGDEYIQLTNPRSWDTDADGLPDRWEVDYAFAPANSYDAFLDPDYDGLTNLQEYQLGTITWYGVLSYGKDLFVEIDYMVGYAPSTEALDWFVSYYRELNIAVHVTVDDEVSNDQLSAIGVSPEYLTGGECTKVVNYFHDNPRTHVYVFYSRGLEPLALGWANLDIGAFINKGKVNANEGLWVLWLTDRIKTEKVTLLHEIGHTLNVIITDKQGQENYCSKLGCIMAGVDRWWDIVGRIADIVVLADNTPKYCSMHTALIDLTDKWGVDECWKLKNVTFTGNTLTAKVHNTAEASGRKIRAKAISGGGFTFTNIQTVGPTYNDWVDGNEDGIITATASHNAVVGQTYTLTLMFNNGSWITFAVQGS